MFVLPSITTIAYKIADVVKYLYLYIYTPIMRLGTVRFTLSPPTPNQLGRQGI